MKFNILYTQRQQKNQQNKHKSGKKTRIFVLCGLDFNTFCLVLLFTLHVPTTEQHNLLSFTIFFCSFFGDLECTFLTAVEVLHK